MQKVFDKIQHPFVIKAPESRQRRNIPQHNKSHIWHTHSIHYPQRQKIESISSKIRDKTRVPTHTTTIQHSFGSPSHSSQRRKRHKRDSDWKRRSKLPLFAGDMILCIENPKHPTRKFLELIDEYSNIAGYKINIQKSLAFLYTSNEKRERQIKETIHSPLQWKE